MFFSIYVDHLEAFGIESMIGQGPEGTEELGVKVCIVEVSME